MPPPCKFYQSGHCSKGRYCEFTHTDANDVAVCRWYLQGECKRGSSCAYRHSKQQPTKRNPVAVAIPVNPPAPVPVPAPGPVPVKKAEPVDEYSLWGFGDDEDRDQQGGYFYGAAGTKFEPRGGHTTATAWGKSRLLSQEQQVSSTSLGGIKQHRQHPYGQETNKEEELYLGMQEIWGGLGEGLFEPELECGICLSEPAHNAYGLLSHCTCVFCLKCIKNWRREKEMKQDTTRACPLCRATSYFIVPSYYTFAISGDSGNRSNHRTGTDLEELRSEVQRCLREAKDELVERHLASLKKRVCKFFNETGECPHGSSCHFRHIDPGGDEVEETKPRFLLGAGDTTLVTSQAGVDQIASLADYLK